MIIKVVMHPQATCGIETQGPIDDIIRSLKQFRKEQKKRRISNSILQLSIVGNSVVHTVIGEREETISEKIERLEKTLGRKKGREKTELERKLSRLKEREAKEPRTVLSGWPWD